MANPARTAPVPARPGLKSVEVDRREEAARRTEIGDWPDFVDHPHFHSARRRLPPEPVTAKRSERAGFAWAEFVATFVAGFSAGALVVLILAWGVAR